jgi:TfoX/Sxy family transcriptional regulator of competence genes
MMHAYLHDTVIKSLVLEENEEKKKTKLSNKEYEVKAKKFLANYGLTCISNATVYRWMLRIGFKHETRRKGYYVDGHEKKATIEYRWSFCDRYLLLERRMHRWIQVPLEEAKRLKDEKKVAKNSGYEYTDQLTGQKMVEFHVDTCKTFMQQMNEETRFGGNLSVRMLPCQRPVIVMGQDECIVKQYSFTKKAWLGPEGEQPITPKDDGHGVMISAMQSREFGYGMVMTPNELQHVNAVRLGQKYKDEQAAIKKRGTADKQPLTMSPFVLQFEYGASAEGYWTYDSMVLQLEDCADVVTTLYPQYQFLFLFDHSCGHDRAREDALNVNNMNTGYGGKQT